MTAIPLQINQIRLNWKIFNGTIIQDQTSFTILPYLINIYILGQIPQDSF